MIIVFKNNNDNNFTKRLQFAIKKSGMYGSQ